MTNLPTILRSSAVPFRQIDSVFDNLFNDFFNTVSRTPFNSVTHKSNYPRVDIRETRDAVTLDATVPGLRKEDVSIDYEDLEFVSEGVKIFIKRSKNIFSQSNI